MEEQWVIDRARLRALLAADPTCPRREMAAVTGRSLSWVKKWIQRLREADPDDETVLHRRPSRRQRDPSCRTPPVVERILAIRDSPPEGLQRLPGPKAILYYLAKDEVLKASEVKVPRSTRTVWQVLDEHGRIARPMPRVHEPMERPAPMAEWQMDLKDATTVPPDPDGKQQHAVEILNVVDAGTAILLDTSPRQDYNAETVIHAITNTLLVYGRPPAIRFDRDPRFVGSWSGRDFPSPLMRFLLCLGIAVHVCPPRRPDKNAVVERFHRTLEEECLGVHRPATLERVREVTRAFQWHYNTQRPHQSPVCDNRPPYAAFPHLPKLPTLPATVDPDRWLRTVDGKYFKRRVKHNGTVQVSRHDYYINKKLRGRYVVLRVEARRQEFVVQVEGKTIKRVGIKGLYREQLDFGDYLACICEEAISDWRYYQHTVWRRVTI